MEKIAKGLENVVPVNGPGSLVSSRATKHPSIELVRMYGLRGYSRRNTPRVGLDGRRKFLGWSGINPC
jgi:hypothetical protein